MATAQHSTDNSWVTESPDRPKVPAEVVFLLVVLMLTIIFSIAGIPGEPEPVAGDGSPALQQGWLAQHEAREGGNAADAQR
jgi:hypothetical protein